MINFDLAEYLKNRERVFLQEIADTGDASDCLHAAGIVARANGINVVVND